MSGMAASRGSRSGPQIAQHDLDDVAAAGFEPVGRAERAAENGRERVAVRQIEKAEGRDADVKLDRIDTAPEQLLLGATLQQPGDDADQRPMQIADLLRALEISRLMQILGCE